MYVLNTLCTKIVRGVVEKAEIFHFRNIENLNTRYSDIKSVEWQENCQISTMCM